MIGRVIHCSKKEREMIARSGPATSHLTLNMGPQHPSTHGVLRLELVVEGEVIVECKPDIGYLHRGIEKIAEARTYSQFLPYTDRLDYLSSPSNNLAYVQAVEKLAGVEVPERAQFLRVLLLELNRIASHLVFVATFANDVGATTAFLYGFREREPLMDLFEMWTGSRLTQSWIRIGGVGSDLPDGFVEKARQFCAMLLPRLDEYDRLLTGNRIFRARLEGVGMLSLDTALDFGCSGPTLRGSGDAYDIRKAEPYEVYKRLEFDVPTDDARDCMGRYRVRMQEMRQSVRIVEQCLTQLPSGEVGTKVSRNLRPPAGEALGRVESPRGDFGCYVVSDGGPRPVRVRVRTPSFYHIAALPELLRGWKIGDVVAILGSVDIVLGEIDR
jgi:NADH-quinone oxidoreductase subunit D